MSDLNVRSCGKYNLPILMSEMYKSRNDLNPSFMQEIFRENTIHYNLRSNNEFIQLIVRSVNNGTESVRFKCPQLWQTLPPRYRIQNSFFNLKQNKNWYGEYCPCKLFRIFIPNLGKLHDEYFATFVWII